MRLLSTQNNEVRGLKVCVAWRFPANPEDHLKRLKMLDREWSRHCRKEYWTKMVQNGPDDHFGQNDLIPNWFLAFARPTWTKMVHFGLFWPEEVHFGPFRSANRTLAIPDWNRLGKQTFEPLTSLFSVLSSLRDMCVKRHFLQIVIVKRWILHPRRRKTVP